MKKLILTVSLVLISCLAAQAQQNVTLSTYYPAPFGSYDRLRLVPRIIEPPCDASLEGLMYYDASDNVIKICHSDGTFRTLAGVWTQDNATNSIYPSETPTNPNLKVGIGTTAPDARLHVTNPEWNIIGNWAQPWLSGDVIISQSDPILTLIGDDTSSGLAAVNMVEVNSAGIVTDKWSIGRMTSLSDPYSAFYIGYMPPGAPGWSGWSSYQKLSILPNGNVGIGTDSPNPNSTLHISGSNGFSPGESQLLVSNSISATNGRLEIGYYDGVAFKFARLQAIDDTGLMPLVLNGDGGNVGIGETDPQADLHIKGDGHLILEDTSLLLEFIDETDDDFRFSGNGGGLLALQSDIGSTGVFSSIFTIRSDGHVGIRMAPTDAYALDVHGTIHADGADLAENTFVEPGVGPGDVVVIAEDVDKKLKKSDRPYDPTIAGVISTDPGFCLAEKKEGYQPLALTGQVPVKATTENGPIKRGDLLTSSSKPGYAMKAEFISLEDTPLPELAAALEENRKRQLAIIGKALEELAEGEGTIVILMAR